MKTWQLEYNARTDTLIRIEVDSDSSESIEVETLAPDPDRVQAIIRAGLAAFELRILKSIPAI